MKHSYYTFLIYTVVITLAQVFSDNANAMVTIEFTGIIEFVGQPNIGSGPTDFAVGDELRGTYDFDESTLTTNSLATFGIYQYQDANLQYKISELNGSAPIAGSQYGNDTRLDGFGPTLARDIARDLFFFFSPAENGLSLPGQPHFLSDFHILLEDFTNNAVPPGEPGSFLIDPPNLSAFPINQFVFGFHNGFLNSGQDGAYEVTGTIVSMNILTSTIPEPVTAALGLMGLGVLGMATRRRAV